MNKLLAFASLISVASATMVHAEAAAPKASLVLSAAQKMAEVCVQDYKFDIALSQAGQKKETPLHATADVGRVMMECGDLYTTERLGLIALVAFEAGEASTGMSSDESMETVRQAFSLYHRYIKAEFAEGLAAKLVDECGMKKSTSDCAVRAVKDHGKALQRPTWMNVDPEGRIMMDGIIAEEVMVGSSDMSERGALVGSQVRAAPADGNIQDLQVAIQTINPFIGEEAVTQTKDFTVIKATLSPEECNFMTAAWDSFAADEIMIGITRIDQGGKPNCSQNAIVSIAYSRGLN
jgi:hypothetical protein